MTLKVFDRVKETTNTTGSGTLTLEGAPTSFQSFSGVLADGESTYYCIQNSLQFEIGQGTYSGNTLSRDVILDSSNNSNKISVSRLSDVFIGYPAVKSVYYNESGNLGINNDNPQFQIDVSGSINLTGDVVLAESADHTESPTAGKGHVWLRSDTPNKLVFTDDTGADFDIGGSGLPFDQDLNTTDTVAFDFVYTDSVIGSTGLNIYAGTTAGAANPICIQLTRASDAVIGPSQEIFRARVGSNEKFAVATNGEIRAVQDSYFAAYNTAFSETNYERGVFKWDTNVLTIGTESLGTGVDREIEIAVKTLNVNSRNSNLAVFKYVDTPYWNLTTTKFSSIGNLDLGDSSTGRLGTVYGTDGDFSGNVAISGGVSFNVETFTAASDTLDANNHTCLCDCTSNAITINLPAAASHTGRVYEIKKIDATGNVVTIDGNGSETIDGALTIQISFQYESVTLVSDGTNWSII